MTWMMLRRVCAAALVVGSLTSVAGCGLLDVSDPNKIEDEELQDATSANLMRYQVLRTFMDAVGYSAKADGLFTDEATVDRSTWDSPTYRPLNQIWDRRVPGEVPNNDYGQPYYFWQQVRSSVATTIPKIEKYITEPARSAYLGQMLAVRGFATLRLAEDICSGFPLHDVVDYEVKIGQPVTTDEALERALADFDSAATLAADSAAILNFARVGKARTLLALGRFAEAATAAATVPPSFHYDAEYSTSGAAYASNPMYVMYWGGGSGVSFSVANRDGVVGLDYVSAEDPRVPSEVLGMANDGVTPINSAGKYATDQAPVVIASGLEARLIEAEAALKAGQPQWITILNDLRTAPGGPGLSDTTAPVSPEAQVDLLFRERAFWLFLTGHRLGDLRRLVRYYDRTADEVFPHGPYRLGGSYDSGESFSFPVSKEAALNPAVTGCLGS